MTPIDLVTAIQSRAWYAVAGVALFLLLDVWKRRPMWVDARIPDGYRWLPVIVIGFLTAFVDGYRMGLTLWPNVAMAVYGVLTISGTAMGVQGALKESPLKGGGQWGGPGGAALLLVLAGACGFSTSGCATLKPLARTTLDVARSLCALHYSEREGLSLDDAARSFCETEAALRPWLDLALRAHRDGALPAAPAPTPAPTCPELPKGSPPSTEHGDAGTTLSVWDHQ